ncbi:MAG: hypothetical protein COA79_24680 [Planctomycetota bacterium]|nr:MAG: hypothetical protein COA79_24680 [Planctomycetota bacterium]
MVKYSLIILLILGMTVSSEDSAELYYNNAMLAKTVGEREENFEKALSGYVLTYNKNRERGVRNGYLSFNIANCYMNLGQLGQSVLYYKEANKLLPENEKISGELKKALSKRVKAIDVQNDSIFNKLFFFHHLWSDQLKITILLVCAFLIAVILFLHIKLKLKYMKSLLLINILLYSIIFLSVLSKDFSRSNIGVIVNGCNIHIDAGENYALLNKELFNIGSTIRVLDLESNWYQVILNNGQIGYIHKEDLQLIL